MIMLTSPGKLTVPYMAPLALHDANANTVMPALAPRSHVIQINDHLNLGNRVLTLGI